MSAVLADGNMTPCVSILRAGMPNVMSVVCNYYKHCSFLVFLTPQDLQISASKACYLMLQVVPCLEVYSIGFIDLLALIGHRMRRLVSFPAHLW